jgi:hypothetical protein
MKLHTLILISSLLLSQLAVAQQGARTIFLIRNAETASPAQEGLSAAGEARAQCLAKMLSESGIKQIFVSDAKRTQATAAPLARSLNITPTIIPAGDPNKLIRDALFSVSGNSVVVGTSETLPFVLARMRAGTVAPFKVDEHDRLFLTTVIEGSATQAIVMRYCESSTGPAAHLAKAATKSSQVDRKKQ